MNQPIQWIAELLRKEGVSIELFLGILLEELIKVRNLDRSSLAYRCYLFDRELDDLLSGRTPKSLIDDEVLTALAKCLNFPVRIFQIILGRVHDDESITVDVPDEVYEFDIASIVREAQSILNSSRRAKHQQDTESAGEESTEIEANSKTVANALAVLASLRVKTPAPTTA